MTRTYATASDYTAYSGQPATSDTDRLLTRASKFLDSHVLLACWYAADSAGMPTDPVVQAAFRDAACAQVEWWVELGDSTGAAGAGWGTVEIGSAKLGRSVTAVSGADAPSRQVAPDAWSALRSPDLTPDRFLLGMVVS